MISASAGCGGSSCFIYLRRDSLSSWIEIILRLKGHPAYTIYQNFIIDPFLCSFTFRSPILCSFVSSIVALLGLVPSLSRFIVKKTLGNSWSDAAIDAACSHLVKVRLPKPC